jgi:hypothetical protein
MRRVQGRGGLGMKFTLRSLTLALKQGTETVPFADVSYFYGQMGAGKSSIARLVDYCLGGSLELSPALQSEFVGATLEIELEHGVVIVERPREADRVIARWSGESGPMQVSLPARDTDGIVIPDTEVENLSDLLFWLSGIVPPRVRKSKTKENSDLARLSIRDLLWYCYLDQDTIDSEFFHLEKGGHPFKQLKSRDVLRFIVGFHEEQVAELESALERLRGERVALTASISGLTQALKDVGVDSEAELLHRRAALQGQAEKIDAELGTARGRIAVDVGAGEFTSHAAETLREQARALGEALGGVEDAIADVLRTMDRDRRHLHEVETLTLKFRRSVSAKAVLAGVTFESCPRCAKPLPAREPGACAVCDQGEEVIAPDPTEIAVLERDAKARVAELTDVLARHQLSLERSQRERERLAAEKLRVERERNEALRHFDSAYLSTMLAREHQRAALLQEVADLERLSRLPQALNVQRERLEKLNGRASTLNAELRAARDLAERDSTNLDRLKGFFLDCLLRAGVPGISDQDRVEIRTPGFVPEVYGPEAVEATVTSFTNLSSGGKKTLFKCCFAVAVHRLAVSEGATLPKLLIVDSPMKNISERENREQFEGFHRLLYELKAGELAQTQLILIDKEHFAPSADIPIEIEVRHMRPNGPEGPAANEFPPLIRYYQGH